MHTLYLLINYPMVIIRIHILCFMNTRIVTEFEFHVKSMGSVKEGALMLC